MSIVNGSIQIANYTQAEWQAWNGVLKSGQIAFSTDQFYGSTNAQKYKVGNGVDTWSNLDYHPDTTGGVTGSNGITVAAGDAKLGGTLIQDTSIAAGAFDFKVTGVPKANYTTRFESSQDLFDLQALIGLAINGQGFKYNLTFDGGGNPTSWLFVKVSDDLNVGGTYNASIGYINLLTNEETFFESTAAGLRAVTGDGLTYTGMEIDRVTEVIDFIIAGLNKISIAAAGITLTDFAGGGTQVLTVNNAGLVGVGSVPASSQVGGMSMTIEAPADGDYTMFLKLPYGITITETTTKCLSGTATATFKINATPLGGTANAISSVEQSQAHASANVAAANDDIVVTISANANCSKATLTVKYTYTLA